MKRIALACAAVACLVAGRARAQSHGDQTVDIDVATGFGGVQTSNLGSHMFSLDATLPTAGVVHQQAMGNTIGLGQYVFGAGGITVSVAYRPWHLALGGGVFFSGGGPALGTIGGYSFGQSASISGGYIDPQGDFRIHMGHAGDLELRPGVRIGGESISIPVTGPATACAAYNCGTATIHYDDLIIVPHFGINWLGGSYDAHGSGFEVGVGIDVGVMVYPELGFQAQASITMRMPVGVG